MRILALTNLFPNPFQPSKAPFVRNELKVLAESHFIRVISPISWTDEVRWRLKGRPQFLRKKFVTADGFQVDFPRYWYPPGILRRYYGHFFYRCVRKSFHALAAAIQPDLIYTPWAYPDGWAAVQLAGEIDVPVVVKVHGSDILLLNEHVGRQRPTAEAVCGADGVVAVSRDLARRLRGMGVSEDRIHLNYGGVDRAAFLPGDKAEARRNLGLPTNKTILLYIGNLVTVKDIPNLLRACSVLRQRGLNFELRIIGEGPLRRELTTFARQQGLADRVLFQGAMPQAQLGDWYRAADLLVLSSRSEGVPTVLLEASACGTPYVATSVGGIPEILDWGRGRLVSPGNSNELADGIEQALTKTWNPGERILGRSNEDSARELEHILQQVVDVRKSMPRRGVTSFLGALSLAAAETAEI
jgi:glycosyltransferase involved in cell wall biosynthesis